MKLLSFISALMFGLVSYASQNPDVRLNPPAKRISENGIEYNLLMTQTEAIEYCASRGERLPTARELTIYMSKRTGTVGISDIQMPGYNQTLQVINIDGTGEIFYYNRNGCVNNPNGADYWSSSSKFIFKENFCQATAYNSSSVKAAVTCVINEK